MAARTHLSFLSYAVNGGGLGHVVRQAAVQRWLRRLCTFAGVRSEHWFLTTSEADTLLFHDGFASFKMPSKTLVDEAGVNKATYVALAKQWVWTTLTTLRPDVLLVDTFPNGSFHELSAALDLVSKRVLVLRAVKEDFADKSGFAPLCALYDKVIVPGDEDEIERMDMLLGLPPGRLVGTGPIVGSERWELRPRADARAALGVHDDAPAVLVSGGGGGDPGVDALFDEVTRALAGRDVHIVYAAGPLFRGAPRRGPRVTWLTEPSLAPLLEGIDVAVCAAGYNTFHELLAAGVPAVFVPQEKIADDQAARARHAMAHDAARVASLEMPGTIAAALHALLDDADDRARVSKNATALVTDNSAKDAALEVLALSLPRSVLRQARTVLTDELLRDAARAQLPLSAIVDVAAALAPDDDRAALELADALALLQGQRAPADVCARVAASLKKKAPGDDLAAAVRTLLSHHVLDGQWGALQALVAALGNERSSTERAARAGPHALVDELLGYVDAALTAGVDAFGAARILRESADAAADEGARTNRALLRSARGRLTQPERA